MEADRRLVVCCIVGCLFVISWPTNAQRQRPTDCLTDQSVECLVCSSNITVHPAAELSIDCGPLVENRVSLNGRVCRQLVHAIESIAARHTIPQPGNCTAVYLYPTVSGEPHVVPAAVRVITNSVVMRGVNVSEQDTTRNRRQAMPPLPTASNTPRQPKQPQVCLKRSIWLVPIPHIVCITVCIMP